MARALKGFTGWPDPACRRRRHGARRLASRRAPKPQGPPFAFKV